jgi:hypothetical protein
VLFTDYIFAVEITAVLLTVAVVGAVVLARRAMSPIDVDEFPDGPMSDVMRARRTEVAEAQADEVESTEDAELEAEEVES